MILNNRYLTEDIVARFTELHKTDRKAAKRYLSSALQTKKTQTNEWANKILQYSEGHASYSAAPDETIITAASNTNSLDEVVKAAKVDLNKWEVFDWSLNRETKTKKVDGKSVPVPVFNFRIKLKQKRLSPESALDTFKAQAAEHAPKSFTWKKPSKERDCMYVLALTDLHLNKLAWGVECGADWDMNIAKQAYTNAVDDLMRKVPRDRVEEIVIFGASDFFQTEGFTQMTKAGTLVDTDTRPYKAFDEGCKLMTDTIEKLAAEFRVRVVIIPGNHDEQSSQFLGFYLTAWFRAHGNVVVDNRPISRKYIPYGATLLGFNHGDKVKPEKLPLVIMRENQSIISKHKYVEMLLGHRHSEQCIEMNGVKVRTIPALCSSDKWHQESGYSSSVRTSQGLLYQKENGIEAIYYSVPLEG